MVKIQDAVIAENIAIHLAITESLSIRLSESDIISYNLKKSIEAVKLCNEMLFDEFDKSDSYLPHDALNARASIFLKNLTSEERCSPKMYLASVVAIKLLHQIAMKIVTKKNTKFWLAWARTYNSLPKHSMFKKGKAGGLYLSIDVAPYWERYSEVYQNFVSKNNQK